MYSNLLIYNIRREKNISRKMLCYGLCDESYLARAENDTKRLNYNLRWYLLSRLGVDLKNSTQYLLPSEFKSFKLKKDIYDCFSKNSFVEGKKILDSFGDIYIKKSCLEKQFYYDVLSEYYKSINKFDEAYSCALLAIDATCPNCKLNNFKEFFLSSVEICLLIKQIDLLYCLGRCSFECSLNYLYSIFLYIKSHFEENENLAAFGLFSIVSNKLFSDNSYKRDERFDDVYIFIYSYLMKNDYSYGLKDAIAYLNKNNLIDNQVYKSFCDLFKFTADFEHSYYNLYYYFQSACIPISDIFVERKKIFAFNENDFTRFICSSKTLKRIEKGRSDVSDIIYKEIMDKLMLPLEYQVNEFYAQSLFLYENLREFRKYFCDDNYNMAKQYLKVVDSLLKSDYLSNAQMYNFYNHILDYYSGRIDIKEYIEDLRETLTLTIPNVDELRVGYYTIPEMYILNQIKNFSEDDFSILFEKIVVYMDNKGLLPSSSYKSLFYKSIADYRAKEKDFVVSNRYIYRSIEVSVCSNHISYVLYGIYDLLWNKAVQTKNYFEPSIIKRLNDLYIMSRELDDISFTNSLNRIIKLYNNRDNSWIK